jgi:hypothetical protein
MTLDPALGSQAVLRFLPGWQQFRDGLVERGGRLSIAFDPQRVTGCRRTWRGAEVWDIEAVIKFHPRGDLVRGSVMEPIRTDGVVTALSPKPLQMAVPSDAMQVEIWFHNFAEIGGRCDAWDSETLARIIGSMSMVRGQSNLQTRCDTGREQSQIRASSMFSA